MTDTTDASAANNNEGEQAAVKKPAPPLSLKGKLGGSPTALLRLRDAAKKVQRMNFAAEVFMSEQERRKQQQDRFLNLWQKTVTLTSHLLAATKGGTIHGAPNPDAEGLIPGSPLEVTSAADEYKYFDIITKNREYVVQVRISPKTRDGSIMGFGSTKHQRPDSDHCEWMFAPAEDLYVPPRDPNFVVGYFHLAIQTRKAPATYTLLLTQVEDSTPIIELTNGLAYLGEVEAEQFRYFKIKVPDDANAVHIKLSVKSGEGDLFVCNLNTRPSKENCLWQSEEEGDDCVLVSYEDENFRPGWFYIGCFGYVQSKFVVAARIMKDFDASKPFDPMEMLGNSHADKATKILGRAASSKKLLDEKLNLFRERPIERENLRKRIAEYGRSASRSVLRSPSPTSPRRSSPTRKLGEGEGEKEGGEGGGEGKARGSDSPRSPRVRFLREQGGVRQRSQSDRTEAEKRRLEGESGEQRSDANFDGSGSEGDLRGSPRLPFLDLAGRSNLVSDSMGAMSDRTFDRSRPMYTRFSQDESSYDINLLLERWKTDDDWEMDEVGDEWEGMDNREMMSARALISTGLPSVRADPTTYKRRGVSIGGMFFGDPPPVDELTRDLDEAIGRLPPIESETRIRTHSKSQVARDSPRKSSRKH
mmetsp:Transcript_36273/g.94331  ORF Transcript_36273/g.94331 Transcript_36273/m.94331 type:complete len:645 (-) Transcript_36273:348-2282(-)